MPWATMSDHFVRAQLVKLEVDRLVAEGREAAITDPDRAAAICAELDVLVTSLEAIRREQLIEQLAPPPRVRRRWSLFGGRRP
jgi:hypothetical protein